jgi:hypothetical protein
MRGLVLFVMAGAEPAGEFPPMAFWYGGGKARA